MQAEWEYTDEYLDDHKARALALEWGTYPPSAYDLIVTCNFLTNTEITAAFEPEIRQLAFSLTPGGILLVLGATGGTYPQVYAQIDSLVSAPGGPRLKKVLETELQAHAGSPAQKRVAAHVIRNLAHLQETSPDDFDAVRARLSPDVRALNAADVRFPRFTVRAYKREGPAALSRAGRRRRRERAP